MNLSQALMQNGAIDSMAGELGVDQATAQKAASALLPAIVAGMGRQSTAASPASGLGGLGSILGGLAGGSAGGGLGSILLDSVLNKNPTPTAPGNDILGEIFGGKDVSRGVAEEVAGSTGLPAELLKKMLPILVTAVVGYMMNQNKGGTSAGGAGGGALGGALGGLLTQVVAGMGRR